MNDTEKDQRWKIFRALLPYYGKIVTPQFLRKTSDFIPEIERIHPLIEGIYKPAWSKYALSIASMKNNPYADKLSYLPDGRWLSLGFSCLFRLPHRFLHRFILMLRGTS